MEMSKTKLHVVFVGTDRRIVREVYSECYLSRDCGIPHIHILDNLILDILNAHHIMPMPFYDIKADRFNFKVSDLLSIINNAEEDPDEILLEILEVESECGDIIEYIHLEPGLWKTDESGKYRICDDSIYHIIMDTKVLPLVEDNTISFDDGAAMTLFSYLINNMSFHYFDHSEDDEDDCECDGNCDECDECDDCDFEYCCKTDDDCVDCDISDDDNEEIEINNCCKNDDIIEHSTNIKTDESMACKFCGCPNKDICNTTTLEQTDSSVESLYPKIMVADVTDKSYAEGLSDIIKNRITSIKNKSNNKIKSDDGVNKYYGTIRRHKRSK